jgi:protein phosphatase
MIFAVDETQKRHPENTFKAIYANLISRTPGAINHITSSKNARQLINQASVNEIVRALAIEVIKIYNYCELIKRTDPEYANQPTFKGQYQVLIKKCPGYEMVNSLVRTFARDKVNIIAYLLSDNKALLDALQIVDRYYYSYDGQYREVLEKYGLTKASKAQVGELVEKVETEASRLMNVSNVHVNMRTVNRCYSDVINGIQVKNKYNDYALGGNLFATQSIGKVRHNQEDSVIIMEHPANKDFKLLVVSDGMGGGIAGEDVSSYTVRTIARWFESVNPAMYENPQQLQYLFNTQINEISNVIFKKYNSADQTRAGATFTGAIITKDQTVITQIGDSRAYIVNNGNLLRRENINLITRDESFVWPVDKDFHPKDPKDISPAEIEDSKYYNRSNVILRCIGDENVGANDQSFMIPNTSYDKLLLMSDGASDLLSFEGIKIICRNTPWEYITKYLVEAALKKNAIRGKEWDAFYTKLVDGTLTEEELARYNALQGIADAEHKGSIAAGKDNTTVAGYFRR